MFSFQYTSKVNVSAKERNGRHPHIILMCVESLDLSGRNKVLVSLLHSHTMQHTVCIIRKIVDHFSNSSCNLHILFVNVQQ